jgi:hypothetical protein
MVMVVVVVVVVVVEKLGLVGFDHLDRPEEIQGDRLDGRGIGVAISMNERTRTLHVETKGLGRIHQIFVGDGIGAIDVVLAGFSFVDLDGDGLQFAEEAIDGLSALDASLENIVFGLEQVVVDEDGHGGAWFGG